MSSQLSKKVAREVKNDRISHVKKFIKEVKNKGSKIKWKTLNTLNKPYSASPYSMNDKFGKPSNGRSKAELAADNLERFQWGHQQKDGSYAQPPSLSDETKEFLKNN